MSLRNLKNELDAVAEKLYERIDETIEQHGLDTDSPEVLDVIRAVFGDQVVSDYADWYGG
jgi:glutamate-1-semialdehyde aminotransferase